MFDSGKAQCGERRDDYASDAEVKAYCLNLCREVLMAVAREYKERHAI